MTKKGFSLVELIVVMAIFAIVIGIPYKLFIQELKITVRETSLSQTSIEQVPSLEILRRDIEKAGFGLPWGVDSLTYSEVTSSTLPLYSLDPSAFNDSPDQPPRAVIGEKDPSGNGFSYLVLKSTSFGLNKAANHWTYIDKYGYLNVWDDNSTENYNNLANGDRVIVMDVGNRMLKGGSLYYTVTKNADSTDVNPVDYGLPALPQSVYLIYGIDDANNPRAPFNRIDYMLYQYPNSSNECATGTYTLVKSVMDQSDGSIDNQTMYPILSCVADFQVAFGLDTNGDGDINKWIQDFTAYDSAKIRKELKQVRVYILMQNGAKDMNYDYPNDNVTVGETINGTFVGRVFDLSAKITDYKHYRWKVVKIIATPKNLE